MIKKEAEYYVNKTINIFNENDDNSNKFYNNKNFNNWYELKYPKNIKQNKIYFKETHNNKQINNINLFEENVFSLNSNYESNYYLNSLNNNAKKNNV